MLGTNKGRKEKQGEGEGLTVLNTDAVPGFTLLPVHIFSYCPQPALGPVRWRGN